MIAAIVAAGLAIPILVILLVAAAADDVADSAGAVVVTGDNTVSDVHRFSSMPADDGALEAWLQAQSGVQAVGVRRIGSDGLRLTVRYLPSGSGDPQPGLSPPWESLGYRPAPGTDRSLHGPGPLSPLPPLDAPRR